MMTQPTLRFLVAVVCFLHAVCVTELCGQDEPVEPTKTASPQASPTVGPTVQVECRLVQVLQVDLNRDWTSTLTGSKAYVNGKLDAMIQAGELLQTNRMHLTAIAGNQARLQTGKQESIVTARQVGANGRTLTNSTRQATGTSLECTPEVFDDTKIMLNLSLEKSEFAPTVVSESPEDEDAPVSTPPMLTQVTTSQVRLVSGTATVVAGVSQDSGERPNQWLMVVYADIVSSDLSAEAEEDSP
ncbi:MAG: hypothetical protein R3C28_09450 [Pirellulaceae bacterium]